MAWLAGSTRPEVIVSCATSTALPGWGWKAQVVDALRPASFLLAPLAPLAVGLMNLPPLYRALYPPIRRTLGIAEAIVPAEMTAWHTYTLEWGERTVRFGVDGETFLSDAPAPRGPLGFVLWLDNQYLVATPQGRVRWGLLEVAGEQWLEVGQLTMTNNQ